MAAPYRPPAAGRPVVWPAALGPRFVLFVDTEEEFDWAAPFSRESHGTRATRALPAAHRRFAAWGVPIAYMVDYPVVRDPYAVEALSVALEDGGSTIGAQLHAWVTPPFAEPLCAQASYAGNLPRALEAAKLDRLIEALRQAFGRRPRAYRAGRYGIGANTLDLLAARGFALDSSVRARHDYRGDGGPDFRHLGPDAYRCGPGGALIELPLTTVFTGALRAGGAALYEALGRVPRARGAFARGGLLQRVALTPEGMPLAAAQEAVRVALGEGVQVLSFAFHSPSLAPGHTPYVRDAADLAAFWRWWAGMLALLDARGVKPIGLDALIDAAG
ncbi:MAG: WalW protein [Proteobacteria bacterium SG_bin5]|nr:polysaccharide deacetylase family protein [Sphingomonas sp.]OQW40415.1 MAG: WalW protein [Proteobacteria bacterium SG_bin5]